MSQPERQTLVINIDTAAMSLKAGVNRVAVFLGLGVNAATDPDFDKIQLSDAESNIRLLPDPMPPALLAEAKLAFKLWIQAGGFRELCEVLEAYFTQIYSLASMFAASDGGRINSGATVGPTNEFQYAGLVRKLELLRDTFAIAPANPDHLATLWKARNCLGHRRGRVGEQDVASGATALVVCWLGLDAHLVEPDGRETLLPPGFQPVTAPSGGEIHIRVVERRREFPLGTRIDLSPHDLNEICWFVLRELDAVRSALLAFAASRGIPIDPPAPLAQSPEQSGQ
jgi:hypothetical protein